MRRITALPSFRAAVHQDVLNEAYESGRTELSDFFSGIAWLQKAS